MLDLINLSLKSFTQTFDKPISNVIVNEEYEELFIHLADDTLIRFNYINSKMLVSYTLN